MLVLEMVTLAMDNDVSLLGWSGSGLQIRSYGSYGYLKLENYTWIYELNPLVFVSGCKGCSIHRVYDNFLY